MLETFKLQTHIGADGILKVELPTALKEHEVEVVVILHPLAPTSPDDDWSNFVDRFYGALAHDPIERLPQLPLEVRDSIE